MSAWTYGVHKKGIPEGKSLFSRQEGEKAREKKIKSVPALLVIVISHNNIHKKLVLNQLPASIYATSFVGLDE